MILNKYTYLLLIFHFLLIGCTPSIEKIEGVSTLDLETDWSISKIAASPDGAYLSFNVVGNDDQGIYILEIENENYYPVQKDNDRIWYEAHGAAWSPDSTTLVAFYPSSVVGALGAVPQYERPRLISSQLMLNPATLFTAFGMEATQHGVAIRTKLSFLIMILENWIN
ncbi:MAG: hypothetical protein IPH82_06935 [Chloroflexi bacterium]|nr:hypothetical protein [Chloroflexota bacterium]